MSCSGVKNGSSEGSEGLSHERPLLYVLNSPIKGICSWLFFESTIQTFYVLRSVPTVCPNGHEVIHFTLRSFSTGLLPLREELAELR
jgi:hypothetical protein